MLRSKKNSYKEFDNEKKFLRLENPSPPPPPPLITFLMVLPLEGWPTGCVKSSFLLIHAT